MTNCLQIVIGSSIPIDRVLHYCYLCPFIHVCCRPAMALEWAFVADVGPGAALPPDLAWRKLSIRQSNRVAAGQDCVQTF